ncbi:hypothetical protein B0T24DRAFT_629988 [Lasiosphaeria ovina]|uniref:Uncharacterized protein n=1 Tax=Lasiosphaeria ovina TaxID=92902 RepID=A0AAE0K918_9PEZI|nr:hypothetical protein B0T24DRAFT_629988 [Lasiosphaeria ovina]
MNMLHSISKFHFWHHYSGSCTVIPFPTMKSMSRPRTSKTIHTRGFSALRLLIENDMPVIRAEDIVRIMVGIEPLNGPATEPIWVMAERIMAHVRELAEQVICRPEEMQYAGERSNLLTLPISVLPLSARALGKGLYEEMGKPLGKWSEDKEFCIEPTPCHGPTLLWLQGGGVACPDDMVAILVFVHRPRPRSDRGAPEGISVPEESPLMGIIKSSIGGPIVIPSRFECQVGDIIILEAKEQLFVTECVGPRDICMFSVMHRTFPRKDTSEGGIEEGFNAQ